jgi:fumarate reductase subunit C
MGAEVSVIFLDIVVRFKILIIYSIRMALWTIIKIKSRFVRFLDNVVIIIRNIVVRTRLYIIDSPSIKVVLGFLFI